MRDEGLFESALERADAVHLRALPELAACYGFGLAKNHALLDGNERLGFLATGIFLRMSKYEPEPGRRVRCDQFGAIDPGVTETDRGRSIGKAGGISENDGTLTAY